MALRKDLSEVFGLGSSSHSPSQRMFALESFPSPGPLQISTLLQDGCKYMLLLHIPSSGFQEEKLCLFLRTNTPEETQNEGTGDGSDSPGQGIAVGHHRTLVCTPACWSNGWPWQCPGLGFGALLRLGLSVGPEERHHGSRNDKFPQI